MRLRLANGTALAGLTLLLVGGGVNNVRDLAGMYQWAARLLIVAGVVFCGVHLSRKGLLREQEPDMPSRLRPQGEFDRREERIVHR